MHRALRPFFSSIAILLASASFAYAQGEIWTENFNNGCASNCVADTYGGWSIVDNYGGTSGAQPNNWFVSCAEEGIAAPGCGSTCVGDASLHIGNDPGSGGDMGADFSETDVANATYRLAVSPTISTVGHTALKLEFDFIAFGSAACSDDSARLYLSTDNGATWPAGYHYCLNSVCCGACNGYSQGQWTTYSLALPAAFANNPNVRIGFHWRNNGNGSGTSPSVAIDDMRIFPDADDDAVADGLDNCPTIWNPTQVNYDGDALGDVCDPDDDNDGVTDDIDNCRLVVNPDQINSDTDGEGDLCDWDDDNDALADASDNCPIVWNPDQANNDGDALGDLCDADDDNDGVADGTDNCPLIVNPGQANLDKDALGDLCDADDDNDGTDDVSDNCPVVNNPDQANDDSDATGNVCDICPADPLDQCPAAVDLFENGYEA